MTEYAKHFQELRRAAPRARCIEIASNHGDRLLKRIRERLPEIEGLVSQDVFRLEGVERLPEVRIDGVQYMHGFRGRAQEHAKYNQCSTVHGHSHMASLVWHKNGRGAYFNLECGWLGDERRECFAYREQSLTRWILSVGLITNGSPTLLKYPGK